MSQYITSRPQRQEDIDPVQAGTLDTGSAWDGWTLEAIYEDLIAQGDRPETAAAMVDAVMENRQHVQANGSLLPGPNGTERKLENWSWRE